MAAAASQQWSQQTWTSSACTPETAARGTHVLRVAGYSLFKGLGVDRSIRSTVFAVGGYHWSIRYYPDGIRSRIAPPGRLVLRLQLVSEKAAEVRARFDFRLVDQATGEPTPFHSPWETPVASFSTMRGTSISSSRSRSRDAWGGFCVMTASELEASTCLRDDCLVVECDVTVVSDPRAVDVAALRVMPPSDLSRSLAKLLEEGKGADVTFSVGDELFPAHKVVLAMRSPVFDAQFYGPMREEEEDDGAARRRRCGIADVVPVEDMQPAVFRALLHFIYTDAMPSMEEGFEFDAAGDRKEMVKHLLVAADRYAVERLKLICEGVLCESLDARDDVEATLALADAHHCHGLRDACAAFLASSNEVGSGGVVASQEVYLQLDRPRPAAFLLDNVSKLKNMRKWMLSCRPTR